MTEKEYKQYIYKKASEVKTKEDLMNLLEEVVNSKDLDYGKIVYAICGSMIATCNYIDRSKVGGITGFQAGFIGWEMIKEYTITVDNEFGMKIINYGDLLYPQYEYKSEKVISYNTWKALQEQAKKKLEEAPDAHPDVIQHWKSIVEGKVPFGYKVGGRRTMSIELEALKGIKNVEIEIGNEHNTAIKVFEIGNDYDEHFRIIEKALKKLEELESRENNVMPVDDFVGDLGEHTADEVAKKLKALEIIKRSPVEVTNAIDIYNTYESMIEDYYDDEITFIKNKEEFELLKEVLL